MFLAFWQKKCCFLFLDLLKQGSSYSLAWEILRLVVVIIKKRRLEIFHFLLGLGATACRFFDQETGH